MQTKKTVQDSGNVIICALIAILIVSLIGANVLSNSTTRLNVSSNQVRGWKEALEAAEAGGEMAFGELRKQISTDATVRGSQWTGWTSSGTTHTSPQTTFGNSNLMTQTTVETFYFDAAGVFHLGTNPDPNQNNWYRIRSKGTSPLPNLKRTGMDDALIQDGQKHFAALGSTQMQDIVARGKGDSLLRKIDFQYDHFVSTYGPNGDGLNKALVAPVAAPSISRRIEQIVTPVTPFFDAAIKANGIFYGLGSAAYIDSYDSRNGPYDPNVKTYPVTHQPRRRQQNRITWVGQARSPSFRLSLIVLAVIAGFALGLLVLSAGPKLVSKWKESRWLRQAETALKQGNFNAADDAAKQALQINHESARCKYRANCLGFLGTGNGGRIFWNLNGTWTGNDTDSLSQRV